MSDELTEMAREKRKHLESWLTDYKQASQAAPLVQQAWELAKWEEDALNDTPKGMSFDPTTVEQLRNEVSSWQSVLRPMPAYDHSEIALVNSSASSGGTAIYTQISYAGQQVQDPIVEDWSTRHTEQYETMQSRHNRRAQVRRLLGCLNPDRVEEFERAWEALEGVRGQWLSQEKAGIAMRNLLEHSKGDLWQIAKRPHEQKFKWPIMVQRLSKTGKGTLAYRTLLSHERTHRQLHQELTQVAKNLRSVSRRDVTALMTRLQDHLFVVLSSVTL